MKAAICSWILLMSLITASAPHASAQGTPRPLKVEAIPVQIWKAVFPVETQQLEKIVLEQTRLWQYFDAIQDKYNEYYQDWRYQDTPTQVLWKKAETSVGLTHRFDDVKTVIERYPDAKNFGDIAVALGQEYKVQDSSLDKMKTELLEQLGSPPSTPQSELLRRKLNSFRFRFCPWSYSLKLKR